MTSTRFWVATLVACVVVSLVFAYRVPLYAWMVLGSLVLVLRLVGDRVRAARGRRASAELEHASLAHEIAVHGSVDDLVDAAIAAARASHASAARALTSRMAPSVAVEVAGVANDLDGYRRSADPTDDLARARAVERRARAAAADAASRGISTRTARGVGTVLGLWRSLDH